MSGSDTAPHEEGHRAALAARSEEPEWLIRLHTPNAAATRTVGSDLARHLRHGDLLVLSGELGAGKTTFTQGLGAGLGVRQGIISPTFVLVRIHPNAPAGPNPGGPDLVHVDAYRLGSSGEIDDIDLENTMDSAVTVVEWGLNRVEHLASSRLEIELVRSTGSQFVDGGFRLNFDEQDDDEPRVIAIAGYGPRWAGSKPTLVQADAWIRRVE